jgi:hypothetical protein
LTTRCGRPRPAPIGARRPLRLLLLLALGAACTAPAPLLGGRTAPPAVAVGRVVRDFAPVYAGPGPGFPLVWRLYEGSQVAVTGDADDAGDGTRWLPIRLWNAHDGWIEETAITFEPFPPPPPTPPTDGGGGGPCAPPAPPPAAPGPRPLTAAATVLAPTRPGRTVDGAGTGAALAAGTPVTVEAWDVGADGRVRYKVRGDGGSGWAAPGTVALAAADPAARLVDGRPIAAPLAGLGLWFTLDAREHGEAAGARVAAAAAAAGLSHLYVEVATSRGGFFGTRWLNELLPAARAAGVRVIGSVYVCLDDPAADLALALAVARYRTPAGLGLDGLTADIEETLVAANVQAFGELLRHHLGDDYLLVATVYPPESGWARAYPWAALARCWNAVAPMAYWRHMEERPFTPEEVYAYIGRQVAGVRALAGRPAPPARPRSAHGGGDRRRGRSRPRRRRRGHQLLRLDARHTCPLGGAGGHPLVAVRPIP